MEKIRYYTQPISKLNLEDYLPIIQMGLTEDCPESDVTSEAIFSQDVQAEGTILTREKGIFCGAGAFECFKNLFPKKFEYQLLVEDGQAIESTQRLARISGQLLSILRIERVLLNIIQYLSGIASSTNKIALEYPNLLILDTRKTLPGYRKLAKYAVYMGGGANHRIDLSDMGLIKDNHIALCGSILQAVNKFRTKYPQKKLELEIDGLFQLEEAIAAKPDVILLDNFSLDDTKKAVTILREKAPQIQIEYSGKITPEKLQALSELGNLGVSMGYLTHTTRFMDFSLEIESK